MESSLREIGVKTMKLAEDMRELARDQAIKSLALVKEAEGRAKETGEDVEKILGMMVMARLEAATTVKMQGKFLAAAYMETHERILLVVKGIAENQAIKKDEVINRLNALADNVHRSAVTAEQKAG